MTRRARKFDLGFMRNRLSFYSQGAPIIGPNGSTATYNFEITRFGSKETIQQGSFYAQTLGISLTTQAVTFFTRQHPTFFPKKNMYVKNENDSIWYKILSAQPLEDPKAFYRIICEQIETSFNPIINTT